VAKLTDTPQKNKFDWEDLLTDPRSTWSINKQAETYIKRMTELGTTTSPVITTQPHSGGGIAIPPETVYRLVIELQTALTSLTDRLHRFERYMDEAMARQDRHMTAMTTRILNLEVRVEDALKKPNHDQLREQDEVVAEQIAEIWETLREMLDECQ
jgi:hypothetical protein